jgi:glucose dehydrogenase
MFRQARKLAYDPRGWNTGQDPAASSMPEDPKVRAQIRAMMKGALVAWDPVAGRRVWSVPMPLPWNGGVLSTAGGLVFQGNGTGEFAAYAADSGRKLWSVNLGSGIVAAPVTYRIRACNTSRSRSAGAASCPSTWARR